MRSIKRRAIRPGIYPTATGGYSVEPRVGSGTQTLRLPPILFPPGTPIEEVEAAFHAAKAKLKRQLALQRALGPRPIRTVPGTLRADVDLYFETAKITKRTAQERRTQFKWWCDVAGFGDRRRSTLEGPEITRALNKLMTMPGYKHEAHVPRRASASLEKKYRHALYHLFKILDGPHAPNPVAAVPLPDEPAALPRDLPLVFTDEMLVQMRAVGQRQGFTSRVRATQQVLTHAPVTMAQLLRMRPGHVDLEAGEIVVPGRQKGQGPTPPAVRRSLTPDGVAAFRAYGVAGCWERPVSKSVKYQAFKRARQKAMATLAARGIAIDRERCAQATVKDLRHTLGTQVFAATGDLAMTALFLDHKDPRTTLRYAQGAVDARLKIANAQLAAALAAQRGTVRDVRGTSATGSGERATSSSTSTAHQVPRTEKRPTGNIRKIAEYAEARPRGTGVKIGRVSGRDR